MPATQQSQVSVPTAKNKKGMNSSAIQVHSLDQSHVSGAGNSVSNSQNLASKLMPKASGSSQVQMKADKVLRAQSASNVQIGGASKKNPSTSQGPQARGGSNDGGISLASKLNPTAKGNRQNSQGDNLSAGGRSGSQLSSKLSASLHQMLSNSAGRQNSAAASKVQDMLQRQQEKKTGQPSSSVQKAGPGNRS